MCRSCKPFRLMSTRIIIPPHLYRCLSGMISVLLRIFFCHQIAIYMYFPPPRLESNFKQKQYSAVKRTWFQFMVVQFCSCKESLQKWVDVRCLFFFSNLYQYWKSLFGLVSTLIWLSTYMANVIKYVLGSWQGAIN